MKRTFAIVFSTMALALAALPASAATSTHPSSAAITLRQSTTTVTFPQPRDRANLAVTTAPAARPANLLLADGAPPPPPPAPAMVRKGGDSKLKYMAITDSLLGVLQALL